MMAWEEQQFSSSAFTRIAYDVETQQCAITFKDGSSYILPNLPQEILDTWMGAYSVGGYFNYFIRGNY